MLCVGIDPEAGALPRGFPATLAGVEAFARLVLEASLSVATAVKPNLAFFEAYGAEGIAALERLRALVPPDVPFVADAKRGDIGTTAARQAVALYDVLGADAVTVNPYMGYDSVEPYFEHEGKGVIVLCRTSNPGGSDLQFLDTNGRPLYQVVADLAANKWNAKSGQLGLVVGATFPNEIEIVRGIVGDMPLLIPGIGAQGGDVQATVNAGRTADGTGMMINSSRAILYASKGEDFAEAAALAAQKTRDTINAHR